MELTEAMTAKAAQMSETTTNPPAAAPGSGTGPERGGQDQGRELRTALRPLLLDIALPLGSYYLLRDGFGMSLVLSLALSSVVPAVRTLLALVRERRVNALAALMLAVNAVGIALSFVTGDPRLMIAKDSGVSSVIGVAILVSAFGARPLMTAGLKPMLTKGDAAKAAAWDRLAAGSPAFRRLERRFSVIWGTALLAECVIRLAGAFTLPPSTMVWLGTVLTVAAIGVGILVGGGAAASPMEKLVSAEAATPTAA